MGLDGTEMKKKTIMCVIACLILPLIIIPSMSDRGWALSGCINLVPNTKTDPSTRLMSLIASLDQNDNRIEDSLDREIYSRTIERTVHDPVDVTVMLRSAPTVSDIDDFISSGGKITAGPWTLAIQGFAGTIPYDRLFSFVQQHPEVQLVEKDIQANVCLAYSAQQIGARPYVWNNVGLQGDSNSSIAILDTGIDSSHIDFAPRARA
jgi:hypothetical protein